MNSMTGFGRGTAAGDAGTVTAEVKAVNSRFLEINMRTDHFSAALEDLAARKLKEKLHRGKVNVSLSYMPAAGGSRYSVELDRPLLEAYVKALDEGRKVKGLRNKRPVISDLLSLPQPFITVRKEAVSDETLTPLVEKAMEEAIAGLLTMRAKEGENLKKDLEQRLSFLEEKRQFLLSKQDVAAKEYEDRLKARIDKALEGRDTEVDEDRVLQEVAIYSEKVDYTEEVVRLGSHLSQFHDILESEGPIGRKLDFLLQEINREVNTTASKASDTEVVDCVIIIKTELEKIREQVQNIE